MQASLQSNTFPNQKMLLVFLPLITLSPTLAAMHFSCEEDLTLNRCLNFGVLAVNSNCILLKYFPTPTPNIFMLSCFNVNEGKRKLSAEGT